MRALNPKAVSQKLHRALISLIENEEFYDFRAGGATGFDTVAALTVLNLKKKYPQIKLHLILPCKDQDKFFTPADKRIYKYILSRADSVTHLQKEYSREAMLARNRALVDGSDLCISYLERLEGGTYYTVNYARKQKIKTVNLLRT